MPKLPIKQKVPLIVGTCFFLCVYWMTINAQCNENSGNLKTDSTVIRHVQYSFTLQNKTNSLLEQADFWTYAPVKLTSTQRCGQLVVSHPYELIEDELGNQILHFSFTNFPPYATKIVVIKAELSLSSIPNSLPVDNLKIFLSPEKNVEVVERQLTKLASKLRAPNSVETAKKTFFWVARNIEYTGYSVNNQGVFRTLQQKKGDCTEFMDLFVALIKANTIPARGVAGYVLPENGILNPMAFHNWAEFYDGATWHMADPQKRVFMKNQSDYIAMRIIGPAAENPMDEFNRFRFKGEGLSVKMNL